LSVDRYDYDGKNVVSRDYSDKRDENGETDRYLKLWDFCR